MVLSSEYPHSSIHSFKGGGGGGVFQLKTACVCLLRKCDIFKITSAFQKLRFSNVHNFLIGK